MSSRTDQAGWKHGLIADQPLERIAIWQDKFILQNVLGPQGQVLHKIIDLTGNRPCFIDKLQKTSLDSAQLIKVTLKPKSKPLLARKPEAGTTFTVLAGSTSNPTMAGVTSATYTVRATNHGAELAAAGMGGGNLQIERLVALSDVHLIAPGKNMNAQQRLDAEFYEVEPAAVAPAKPSDTRDAANTHVPVINEVEAPEKAPGSSRTSSPTRRLARSMRLSQQWLASAERIWAKVALSPKPTEAKPSDKQSADLKSTPANVSKAMPSTTTKTASRTQRTSDTNAEIRKAWLWGNVALHQEPGEGKTKGQDATGEALYLDNRGPGKSLTKIYQRDPTEKIYLPGPLPPAWVENEDVVITAAGVLNMNQETDQAWVEGSGTLVQLADRGFLTDKAPTEPADEPEARGDSAEAENDRTAVAIRRTTVPGTEPRKLSASSVTLDDANAYPSADPPVDHKPKTRAGQLITEKVPMTIGFSDGMDFTGKTRDPEGRPAARADFYGIVTAQMEDALLHSEEKMIAYTDREVPLAQLGAMSQAKATPTRDDGGDMHANEDVEAEPKPEISLIYAYRNAVAISRKVDTDSPRVLQQQRIEADDILAYDRRTGDFQVPHKGIVYLYDRSDDNAQSPAINSDTRSASDRQATTTTRRPVTPTSSRVPNPSAENSSASTKKHTTAGQTSEGSATSDVAPLVLTQIHFAKGMIGRFGTGKENDKTETRWAEFYGNVQAARAKVRDTRVILNQDKLPPDGFFMTGQTLRVITEPPPVGSPPSTPARNYLKAWENAYVSTSDKAVQADIITYDSYKDLIYAYGENGRNVIFAEQYAPGQQTQPGSAKAIQLNPKTGALHLVDSDTVRTIDKNTGVRPSPALAPDPYAKPKKKIKKPYKLPAGNLERRGFTGQ